MREQRENHPRAGPELVSALQGPSDKTSSILPEGGGWMPGESKRPRSHLLEINGLIANGCLTVDWVYSDRLHRPSTVKTLAEQYLIELKGLIAHCQSSEACGYWTQFYCRLIGALDLDQFQRAWNLALERHAILRTGFIWHGRNEPLQIVRTAVSLPWEYHDCRGRSALEQRSRLEAYLMADRQRTCDLLQPPLMRLALIQTSDDAHYFVWSHHHLLLDGWSIFLVLKEVFTFYENLRQNRPISSEPTRPYRDYIQWLQKQDLTGAEHYWREALKDFSSPTPLPPSHFECGRAVRMGRAAASLLRQG